jgi:hypothetical protein
VVETGFQRVTIALSYLWEPFLLPGHTLRVAKMREATRRATYELALGVHQDLELLEVLVRTIQQMERRVEALDLSLAASQKVAVEALHAAVAHLRQRLRTLYPPD